MTPAQLNALLTPVSPCRPVGEPAGSGATAGSRHRAAELPVPVRHASAAALSPCIRRSPRLGNAQSQRPAIRDYRECLKSD